jgi:hypothetical protein
VGGVRRQVCRTRPLHGLMGWHESLTCFEGERLCRALGSRVPLFTLLPRSFSETYFQVIERLCSEVPKTARLPPDRHRRPPQNVVALDGYAESPFGIAAVRCL